MSPRRTARLRALLVAALALASNPWAAVPRAHATQGPPIKIRPLFPPRAAVAGEVFQGQLEVTTDGTVELADFALRGKGWSTLQLDAPALAKPLGGDRIVLPFSVVPTDPSQPLYLDLEVEGRAFRQLVDLTPEGVGRTQRGRTQRRPLAEPEPHLPVMDARLTRPGPAPDPWAGMLEGASDLAPPRAKAPGVPPLDHQAEPQKSRSIRVHGRFVYTRNDGLTIGVDGATVRVYDEDDPYSDLLLDRTTTDPNGWYDVTFTWDPCWSCDDRPDIYVEFEAANQHVAVETAFWEVNYIYETPTEDDYEGSDLDFGTQGSSNEAEEPALHILTTITRAWRWLNDNVGYNLEYTEVNWPDGDVGAWYVCFTEELHISSSRQWQEDTAVHEYGHHWICNYGEWQSPDYCNNLCDLDNNMGPLSDCGHCIWCEETDHDAWNEGWPNWFADVVTRSIAADYGVAPNSTRSQETPQPCVDAIFNVPCDCDPILTEGWLGTLLRDIEDSTQDDQNGAAIGDDVLAMGTDEIFDIADHNWIHTPMEFLVEFKNTHPEVKEQLWETARNSGYELDFQPPSAPTALSSPSHPLFGTSTDATVQFTWTRANDDCSGVQGYGLSLTAGSPELPSAVQDIGDVTSYTTEVLAPGSYFFTLRTRDRRGQWSAGAASFGPFTIRAPDAANLAYQLPWGWAGVLVPRPSGNAAADNVPAPTSLTGNAAATYWNLAGHNTGELATSGSFAVRIYVDGVFNSSSTVPAVGAGGSFNRLNRGPMTVRGGRHTYESLLDGNETLAEPNESDNRWADQWIWTPQQLVAGSGVVRSAPPDRTAGWDAIGPGPTLYYNCDGLRLTTSGWWNAVTIQPSDPDDDYDCRLHAPGAGADESTGGFAANAGWSARPAGLLDAVLVNKNVAAAGDWDVGVLNINGGAGSYTVRHEVSQPHPFGTQAVVTLAQSQMLVMRECFVGADEVGWTDIAVDVAPQDGPVHVLWFDESFATGDLADADASTVTDAFGRARLVVNVLSSGYHCMVVYRDPAAAAAKQVATPMDVTIDIAHTPPDYRPYHSPGWFAGVVPRPAADTNPGAVPAPVLLPGNIASTWLNVAASNDSPVGGAIPLQGRIYLEDMTLAATAHGVLAAHGVDLIVNQGPYSIRGGRRTLVWRLDADNIQREISDANNHRGEQWIWSPIELPMEAPVTRGAPPNRIGGFSEVTSGEPLYYNCDGLRTPVFAAAGADGYWGAVAVMPGSASNVDLRMHSVSTGAKNGFAAPLAYSAWGAGQSDFVLVNFNEVTFGPFDAGVVATGGSQPYTVQVTRSMHRGVEPEGSFGPFTLAAQHIVDVHEAWLEPGVYVCTAENAGGNTDWGFSLHPSGLPFVSKSTVVPGGAAWLAPAGADEHLTVEIAQADYYAFAVWKARSTDLPASASYRLVIHGGATAALPAPLSPQATALAGIHPNPFNPRTSIAFDLAQAGEASVQIHTLRGELVTTLLLNQPLSAGRHAVVWDGTSGTGRPVASGIYLVRLRAGGREDTAKALLLK